MVLVKKIMVICLLGSFACLLAVAYFIGITSKNHELTNSRKERYALIYAPVDLETINIKKGDIVLVYLEKVSDKYITAKTEWYNLPTFSGHSHLSLVQNDALEEKIQISGWTAEGILLGDDKKLILSIEDCGSQTCSLLVVVCSVAGNRMSDYAEWAIFNSTSLPIKMLAINKDKIILYSPNENVLSDGFGDILIVKSESTQQGCNGILKCNLISYDMDIRVRWAYHIIALAVLAVSIMYFFAVAANRRDLKRRKLE